MFGSLRARLILSHTLPLILIIPLVYGAVAYLLETRFLLPRLTEELVDNARMVTGVVRSSYQIDGTPADLEFVLVRMDINPRIRMLYLDPKGTLLYANDPNYRPLIGQGLETPQLDRLQSGKDVILTNYSFLVGTKDSIHVLRPIILPSRKIAGILWMTYTEANINQLFQQFRLLLIGATLGSGLIAVTIGSMLAFSLSRPIRQATQAINGLAHGESGEPLPIQGPDEIRELIRAVNILVGRLASMEQARRQLLANLVHELGRPLGALRSAIQALARGASKDPELYQELTSGMDEEAARLQYVVNELAHLHDQVLGSLELKREPTALNEWMPRVLAPWQEFAAQKNLRWQVDIPDILPLIEVDQTRMAQVIGNLTSNAIKYTPAGGSISVSAGQKDLEIWLCFSDTGPGISAEEQEKIFAPFYRGASGRRIKQGMGLGLSIAHELVEAHHGRITVESRPGAGSRFTVWLPIG